MDGSPGALTKTRSWPRNSSTAVTLSAVRCPKRRWLPSKSSPPTKSWAWSRRRSVVSRPVQLEVRPVYHKTDDRIRTHVFLCTLAYYLQWHLKQRLEPLFAADGTHK